MTLATGTRLGPYELLALHGAGGMGEVYRARDTRLDRTVAVKVLPRHLGEDPVLRARLEREARAISALNHPNICALFDIGNQDGVEYLVMEYLDGETLHDRLKAGALPVEQVLRIGIEVAAALESAHRQGIVHRDLKPANIMLTKAGAKLLDFGLAKAAAAPVGAMPMTIAAGGLLSAPSDPSQPGPSPFPSTPLTTVGTILGTFHYMAPEQLEGREVDARSDIFALGSVLYEMATGRRAFEGTNPASVIAAVLERQPQPIVALQPLAPAGLDRLVRVCLAKDPEERWQSAHDVRAQLQGLANDSTAQAVAPFALGARPRAIERWLWAALAATLALVVAYHEFRSRAGTTAAVGRLSVSVLPPTGITSGGPLALRPDGGALAFAGFGDDGVARLWLRPLDEPTARELPGTEDASLPFWSPDGKSLGFFAQRQLKRIEVAGGPPRVLTDVSDARGGTWGANDTIVFAPNPGDGLYRVAAEGGAVESLTRLDAGRGESSHRWPAFLPDGKHVLFLALSGQRERYTVVAAALDGSGVQRVLAADSGAIFAPPGHLLFAQGRSLLTQQFDPRRLKLSGQPLPLAEGVWRDPDLDGLLAFSTAANGAIAYRSGGEPETHLVWFDRAGRPGDSLGGGGVGSVITLSPDGRRLARSGLDPRSGVSSISLGELSGHSFSPLTFNRSNDIYPVWSPDGRRLAFASDRGGSYDLYEKEVDGSGTETALLVSEPWEFPEDWSRDGSYLVFTRRDPRTRSNIWTLELPSRREARVLETEADELQPRLSPDNRWLAYVSDASGRNEVYVQAMPPTASKWQISTAGGFQPQWRRDGRELYYLAPDLRLMAAAVNAKESGFAADKPQALFATRARRSNLKGQSGYLATPDGRRFLIDTESGPDVSSPIHLLFGWAPPP